MNAKIFNLSSIALMWLAIFLSPLSATAEDQPVETEAQIPTEPDTAEHSRLTQQQLYDLLVGELAGVRGNVDLALEKYSQLAFALRNPELAQRAALIANFGNRSEQLLELAILWAELTPDNLDARRLAAMTLARNRQYLAALPHAEFALQQGDSEPLMTLTVLANKASLQQRAALLDAYTSIAPTTEEDKFWLLLTKAMLARSNNQLKMAQTSAYKALKLQPDSETAVLLLAQIYHQQGKRKKALSTLKSSMRHNPDSKRLLIQQVKFVADQDLIAARKLLEKITQQYPDDVQFALTQAQLNLELGLIDQARRNYLKLVQKPAVRSRAYYQLGLLEQQQGDTDQAIAYLRLVRSKNYLIAVAARVTQLLSNTNRVETAQLYLQTLRKDNPGQAATLFQIESEMLMEKARHDDAFGVLNLAITEHPQNIPLLYARSLVGEQLENFEQAALDLRSIVELDNDNAMALNALGYTLTLHTTKYSEAHQLIVRALEIEPEDPATLDSLGWVLFHLKRYEEAITPLETAWQKMPDPEIAAHLGELYWVTGRRKDAEAVWSKILEKQPRNEKVLKTMERLKHLEAE